LSRAKPKIQKVEKVSDIPYFLWSILVLAYFHFYILFGRIQRMFNKWYDFWHFLLGFMTFLMFKYFWVFSVLLLVIYLVYQSVEKEPTTQTLRDFLSYILGFIFGFIVLKP
jgi:small-conductance mechanosensitive channel